LSSTTTYENQKKQINQNHRYNLAGPNQRVGPPYPPSRSANGDKWVGVRDRRVALARMCLLVVELGVGVWRGTRASRGREARRGQAGTCERLGAWPPCTRAAVSPGGPAASRSWPLGEGAPIGGTMGAAQGTRRRPPLIMGEGDQRLLLLGERVREKSEAWYHDRSGNPNP
jgi:hypothetical protein